MNSITIGADGAIKGSVIYAPKGQAGEYAPLATNPYVGCGHECLYCYVPLAMHLDRDEFNAGATLRPNYLERLKADAAKYQSVGITEQIFITFSSDPYHLGDTAPTRRALEILAEYGMGYCTLTKGGARPLRDIDLFRGDRDAFAVTMTSLDDDFSLKWERKAALPADRMFGLKTFHDRGIFTWISLEPTLDIDSSLAVIEATHSFTDLYKVGRANYLKEITRTTDWAGYTRQVIELLNRLGKKHYIKRDLQEFLPAGYDNPLRVQQFHAPATERPYRCDRTMDMFERVA